MFSAISAENAAGTAPGLSSSSVGAGNVIVQSGFLTNTWEGYVRAFDQVALVNFLKLGGVAPSPVWSANFPAPASRNLYTTTAITTPVSYDWGSLTAGQKGLIDAPNAASASSPVLNYLRGDATQELRNGGVYRNRFNTILGDIVNSSPISRIFEVDPTTVKGCLVKSAEQMEAVSAYLIHDLHLSQVQVDELWALLGADPTDGSNHVASTGRHAHAWV